MARSSETFNKKEKEKKRLKKHQDKREKAEDRKANSDKGKTLEEMLAYVDENGNISSTPPDINKKKKINSEDWNTCRIVAKGNHLQHYINGVLMSDVTDNDTVNGKANGLIGVQVHVGPPMRVEYRNIMLKQ